jgi:urea carboxylase
MRFRDRHQDPDATDLEYGARVNGKASVEEFVAAHSGAPWFVSMVGFVAGLPFLYQMVDRPRQLEVPKYLRPRTDTPRLTIGHGGLLHGDLLRARGRRLPDVRDHPGSDLRSPRRARLHLGRDHVPVRPGDIVKFKPVDRAAYEAVEAEVAAGGFAPRMRPVTFSLDEFNAGIDAYNAKLMGVLNGR